MPSDMQWRVMLECFDGERYESFREALSHSMTGNLTFGLVCEKMVALDRTDEEKGANAVGPVHYACGSTPGICRRPIATRRVFSLTK